MNDNRKEMKNEDYIYVHDDKTRVYIYVAFHFLQDTSANKRREDGVKIFAVHSHFMVSKDDKLCIKLEQGLCF